MCLFFPLGRTLEEKLPLHKVTWSDHLTHNSHSQTAWLCLSSKFKINFAATRSQNSPSQVIAMVFFSIHLIKKA